KIQLDIRIDRQLDIRTVFRRLDLVLRIRHYVSPDVLGIARRSGFSGKHIIIRTFQTHLAKELIRLFILLGITDEMRCQIAVSITTLGLPDNIKTADS